MVQDTTATGESALLLDADGAAALLGEPRKTVYRLAESGQLPERAIVRFGRALRFRRPVLEAWARGELDGDGRAVRR